MEDHDRTASLMTPAKLAQVKPRAAANPAAWLDQMASDAGHPHVRRIGELRADLQAQAQARDFAPLAGDLARLAEALPKLDFGLLQPRGLLARISGKNKSAGAEFAAQFDQIGAALKNLATQAKSVQVRHGEQASRSDIALLEMEVEYRAIDKIIDQGARWLQDMRNQLKARAVAEGDDAARQTIREDAARCEILVVRLKALRAVSAATQQSHQQAKAAAARRLGLIQLVQQAVGADAREWSSRIDPLASAAGEGRSPGLNLEAPMESHRELQLRIKQAMADCGQVHAVELALAESLQALELPLKACAVAA